MLAKLLVVTYWLDVSEKTGPMGPTVNLDGSLLIRREQCPKPLDCTHL